MTTGYGLRFRLKSGKVCIAVEFKKGFRCAYPDTDDVDYYSLKNAKSKGKWIWRNIIANDYEELT